MKRRYPAPAILRRGHRRDAGIRAPGRASFRRRSDLGGALHCRTECSYSRGGPRAPFYDAKVTTKPSKPRLSTWLVMLAALVIVCILGSALLSSVCSDGQGFACGG